MECSTRFLDAWFVTSSHLVLWLAKDHHLVTRLALAAGWWFFRFLRVGWVHWGWNTYTLIQRLFHKPFLFEFRKKKTGFFHGMSCLGFLVCNSTEFKGNESLNLKPLAMTVQGIFPSFFFLMKIPDDWWRFCARKVLNKRKGTKQGLLVFSKHQFLL